MTRKLNLPATAHPHRIIDLVGKKFGRLTVVSLDKRDGIRTYFWKCLCDCGLISIVAGTNLKSGHVKSCGCILKDRRKKYGAYIDGVETKEHKAWRAIKDRCYNKNTPVFKHYGGRGIKVCDRWLQSYTDFLDDMGRAPSNKHSLDRRNNDGDYSPDNCRWATRLEQNLNRRNTRFVSLNGVTKPLAIWCSEMNKNYYHVYDAIFKHGHTPEKILS